MDNVNGFPLGHIIIVEECELRVKRLVCEMEFRLPDLVYGVRL
jgi:hypothetical protein